MMQFFCAYFFLGFAIAYLCVLLMNSNGSGKIVIYPGDKKNLLPFLGISLIWPAVVVVVNIYVAAIAVCMIYAFCFKCYYKTAKRFKRRK